MSEEIKQIKKVKKITGKLKLTVVFGFLLTYILIIFSMLVFNSIHPKNNLQINYRIKYDSIIAIDSLKDAVIINQIHEIRKVTEENNNLKLIRKKTYKSNVVSFNKHVTKIKSLADSLVEQKKALLVKDSLIKVLKKDNDLKALKIKEQNDDLNGKDSLLVHITNLYNTEHK